MDPAWLTPSLSQQRVKPLVSKTALFASAFLCGGFGVTFLAAVNSASLNRLRRDAVWIVLGALLSVGGIGFALYLAQTGDANVDYMRRGRTIFRVVGLGLWFMYAYLHREAFRSMETFGTKPRNGWLWFFASLAVSAVLVVLCGLVAHLAGYDL